MPVTRHSRLRVQVRLRQDPADARRRLCADPSTWLPEPTRYRGDDSWTVTVTGLTLRQAVTCRVSPPWSRGTATWRALAFHPLVEDDGQGLAPVLPSFHGEIGVVGEQDGTAVLVLRGRYRPPGGRLGAALDAMALRRVATGTAQALLDAVAARLAVTTQVSQPRRR